MGFVEFTPIPASANTPTTEDNILVALNQKSYAAAPSGKINPDLALTNYQFDWQVKSSSSKSPDTADVVGLTITEDYYLAAT